MGNKTEEEYQYKYRVDDKGEIANRLKNAGLKLSEPAIHSYAYFKVGNGRGADSTVLRLKEYRGKKAIDLKVRNSETGGWERWESEISDSGQMAGLLEKIGCRKVADFQKTRQTYLGEFIRLDLDTIKDVGVFLEAKFTESNRPAAEKLLADIGMDKIRCDQRSILEIFSSLKDK